MTSRLASKLIVAAAIFAAVAGLVVWHKHQVATVINEAVQADRAQWQDAAKAKLDAALLKQQQDQTDAAIFMLEISYDQAQKAKVADASAARTRAVNVSLQRTLTALLSTGFAITESGEAVSLADAAPALAESLGQCKDRRAEVAAVADGLSIQVTGLQDYITKVVGPVCLTK